MSAITADTAAEYLIAFSQEVGDPLTNLKLQKLLYYAQGWYLALYGEPLFDDRIEAWPHGPAVPRIYGRFKAYRWEPITQEIGKPELPERIKAHLDEVMQVFGIYSAYQLERMTHRERPWLEARGNMPVDEPSNNTVRLDVMRDFFREVMAENSTSACP